MLLMLATHFLLMSDRAQIWNADKISHETEIIGKGDFTLDFDDLKDKNVLLLIHGYNNTATDAVTTYCKIKENFLQMSHQVGHPFYDLIIGYLWSGSNWGLGYFHAEKNADKLSHRLRNHLEKLAAASAKLDLLAHSLGNRLVLDALHSWTENAKKVHTYYSLAPAVDNEALEINEKYYLSTFNFENMFVFHSSHDDVLKYLYLFADFDRALGHNGPEHLQYVPHNIQFVDCTAFVDGHSAYFTAAPFYEFIKWQHLMLLPPPSALQNARLLPNGFLEPIRGHSP